MLEIGCVVVCFYLRFYERNGPILLRDISTELGYKYTCKNPKYFLISHLNKIVLYGLGFYENFYF